MKKKILFIDDMKEVYDKVSSILEKRYDVDYTQNEQEALNMIKTKNYDKIITDYHLGTYSPKGGLNIIRVAKDKGLSAILMSTENHEQEALEAGADKFIFKKELYKNIEQIIKNER